MLTLKTPIKTAGDDIHKYFFYCFPEKIRLDISCESSHETSSLIFSEDKSKKFKVLSAEIFVWRFKGKLSSAPDKNGWMAIS